MAPKNKDGLLTIHIWPMFDGHNITIALVESEDADEFISMKLSPSQARMLADMLRSASECEDDEPSISMSTIPFEIPE